MGKQEIQPKEKRSGTGDPARSPVPVSFGEDETTSKML